MYQVLSCTNSIQDNYGYIQIYRAKDMVELQKDLAHTRRSRIFVSLESIS